MVIWRRYATRNDPISFWTGGPSSARTRCSLGSIRTSSWDPGASRRPQRADTANPSVNVANGWRTTRRPTNAPRSEPSTIDVPASTHRTEVTSAVAGWPAAAARRSVRKARTGRTSSRTPAAPTSTATTTAATTAVSAMTGWRACWVSDRATNTATSPAEITIETPAAVRATCTPSPYTASRRMMLLGWRGGSGNRPTSRRRYRAPTGTHRRSSKLTESLSTFLHVEVSFRTWRSIRTAGR